MGEVTHYIDVSESLAESFARFVRQLVSASPRALRLRGLAPRWFRLVRQPGTALALETEGGIDLEQSDSLRDALPGLDALVSLLNLSRKVQRIMASNASTFGGGGTADVLLEVVEAALSILAEDRAPLAVYLAGLAGIFRPEGVALESAEEGDESSIVVWRLIPRNISRLLRDPLTTIREQWQVDTVTNPTGPVAAAFTIASILNALSVEASLETTLGEGVGASLLVFLEDYVAAEGATEVAERVGFRVAVTSQESIPRISFSPIDGNEVNWHVDLMLSMRSKLSFGVRFPASVAFDGDGVTLVGDTTAGVTLRFERYAEDIEGGIEATAGLPAPIHVEFKASFDGTSNDWDIGLSFEVNDVKVEILPPSSDGFLSAVLPSGGLSAEVNFAVEFSRKGGLRFRGGGLSVLLHTQVVLPAVTITQISLGVDPADPIRLWAAMTAVVTLGPVEATVTDLGVRLSLDFDRAEKNLGFVDADLGFKPPTGIGIAIDADIAKGGGFLDIQPDLGRYTGVFELTLVDLCQVSVIAIIDTKMPNGSEGFSFLALLFAQFNPGIELGLAFNLKGVGGLVGIHRTMNVTALETIFREKRAHTLLFPEDPVKNAATLMADLGSTFPVRADRYVFGPAIKLAWGYPAIFTASLGVFIELPGPLKLLMLGELSCVIPDEHAPLVDIHIDVMGRLDLGSKTLAIDGTLRDSKIVGIDLYGDMALRLSWGEDSDFGLSIGGFHPQFTPPADFPPMKRLGMGLTFRTGGVRVSITREIYFAITSNTLQFGSKDELRVDLGGAGLHGWIGFDAILQFSPFSFEVDFDAGLKVWVAGITIASMHVHGLLSGPNPWRVAGEVTISLLFIDVGFDFDASFGSKQDEPAFTSRDPVQVFLDEAAQERNWRIPSGSARKRAVNIATDADASQLPPDGAIAFSQKKVPLGEAIDRFEEVPMGVTTTIVVAGVTVGAEGQTALNTMRDRFEQFAPARFHKMTDAEKLTSRPFRSMKSGFTVAPDHVYVPAAGLSPNRRIDVDPAYDTIFLDMGSDGVLPRLVLSAMSDLAGLAASHAVEGAALRSRTLGRVGAHNGRSRKAVA